MRAKTIALCVSAVVICLFCVCVGTRAAEDQGPAKQSVVAPGAKVEKLADIFEFTEGPASDPKGNVYFTDQPNDKIYKWSTDGKLSVFLAGCERSNGLYFDSNGDLLACADLYNKLVSFDPNGKITTLVENYKGKLLNAPNDLWRDPKGGIYFTDPFYKRDYWKRGPMEQDGQHVYYLKPDRKTLIRVTEDLTQPNGIIGTPDGKLLYVADIGARKTYVYNINDDGSLSGKKLFCSMGSDGMTIDNESNVYLTGTRLGEGKNEATEGKETPSRSRKGVTVFNSAGGRFDHIDINEPWTANVCFGGKEQDTLFITASKSLYSVKMRTRGVTWQSPRTKSLMAPGAKVEKLADGFGFTEGPAADAEGNIYFSDIPNNKILKWSVDGKLSTWRENSGGANGLYFDEKGNLLICEGNNRRVTRIDMKGNVTILADNYKGKKLNSPNDLWRHPKGGIFFTDPYYGQNRGELELPGEYVFYLPPDSNQPILVVDDMVRPNGVIGTADGKTLYVADQAGEKTWVYKISNDGTLSDKKLFAPMGSDGLTLDADGNVYLTGKGVTIFNSAGEKIDHIDIEKGWTANVTFGGKDKQTLFITAEDSLFSVKMTVKGQ